MTEFIKSKPICGRPVHTYFTGKDTYLKVQRHTIGDITPPISENESLFILVTAGCGSITVNGVEFPLATGTFAWLQSYHTFTLRADAMSPLELAVWVYDYPLSSFLTFHEPQPNTVDAIIDATPVIRLEGDELKWMLRSLAEFEGLNESYDPGSSLIKVATLGQFSSFFIKKTIRLQQKGIPAPRPLGWKAILYLSAHFDEDLNADGTAEYYGTTTAALNRELRNITGYNFSQNLNRIRVNIASIALLYEDMSLSYVAEHSGFPSEVAFYRTFKKLMGTTPIEYRNQLLNDGEGVYRGMIMGTNLMEVLNHSYSSFSSPIEIKDTSKKLFISESVIRDMIYEKFGTSYKELTSMTRIRHAEALLLTTDLPVLDIAVNVGYNCSRSFSRAFKKVYGMPPNEYRTKHRGGNQ